MEKVYNFSAGPGILPTEVLENIKKDLMDYDFSGQSVMEMSHRSKVYDEIHNETKKLLIEIMNIPSDYEVLMVPGGGTTQFSAIPMNLYKRGKADYLVSGYWANKAATEASRYLEVKRIENLDKDYTYLPSFSEEDVNSDSDYFYMTTNNTIYGTQLTETVNIKKVPVVVDMSSDVLSRVYDVSKFSLIYAAAQKNMGIAGVTFVIIKKGLLLSEPIEETPQMLCYSLHANSNSILNTPPTFSIYVSKLVFEWIQKNGGVAKIQEMNEEKARILYNLLDESDFYEGLVNENCRSKMNITFKTPSLSLDEIFIKEAIENGLLNLKGHRAIGGMRASIYNAMPIDGVKSLCEFMKKFEMKNR